MSEPRERPIIFSAPMVRALLEGRKTQTRRVVKPQPKVELFAMKGSGNLPNGDFAFVDYPRIISKHLRCPFGVPGDRLWVRENWLPDPPIDGWSGDIEWNGCGRRIDGVPEHYRNPDHCLFAATWNGTDLAWRPSIHMPRWASRITLEITGVRVERLKDISEEDAKSEGALFHNGGGVGHSGWRHDPEHGFVYPSARESFFSLWRSIHGEDSIQENPWLWVVEFQRLSRLDKPEVHPIPEKL